MTEGPYYIVVKGTNQRFSSHGAENPVPIMCDTSELAQKMIDQNRNSWAASSLMDPAEYEPISVAEYNEKYAKMMGIMED